MSRYLNGAIYEITPTNTNLDWSASVLALHILQFRHIGIALNRLPRDAS